MEGLEELSTESEADSADDRYPPPGHFLRHLGISQTVEPDGAVIGHLDARPDLLDARGGLRAGVIAAMVDVVVGTVAIDAVAPDWAATLDLSLHLAEPATSQLTARASIMRAGRSVVVVDVALSSPAGSAGRATVTYSRLTRTDVNPPARPQLPSVADPAPSPCPSLAGFLELRPGDVAGSFELDRIVPVHNGIGAVNGGALAVLAELSATAAADAGSLVDTSVTDLHIHYLAGGRVGPVAASAELVRLTADTQVTRVELRDLGKDNRLITVVTATSTT